jgi:hypothetical protein
LSIATENGNGLRRRQRQQVVDLPAYRRERLTELYHDTHAWDNGIRGHLAALLGCAKTIEESVGTDPGVEGLTALRYGFGLRRARVERAINVLEETSTVHSRYEKLIGSIHNLDLLLESLHQSGRDGDSRLAQAVIKLAGEVKEDLWAALFDASPIPCEA